MSTKRTYWQRREKANWDKSTTVSITLGFLMIEQYIKNAIIDMCMPIECDSKLVPGPCLEQIPNWYYDTATNRCIFLHYGGCHVTKNRFETNKRCDIECLCQPEMNNNIFMHSQSGFDSDNITTKVGQKINHKNSRNVVKSCLISEWWDEQKSEMAK